ncbi:MULTISPECIES: hypothetical protein [unclassified Streptomyces]|nr:hypothetical protein [Streptomyces sp. TSRI0281]
MNGQLGTRSTVRLLAGASSAYVALLHPTLGTALLVGMGVVILLHTQMR